MDKRMQRAKVNAVSTLAHQLVTTVCGLIVPWIMIDTFGSAVYGATTSIAQFLSYISLLEGGIGRVARGAFYKPLADGDNENISRIYLATKRFFVIVGIFFMAYALILSFTYYDIADITEFTREYIFALVIAISIGRFAEYMGGISNITLFNADQKQYVVNSVYIITNIINTFSIVVLAGSGIDILWVKLCSSFVFVLRPIIYTLYQKKHYNIKKTVERAVLKNKYTGIAQHIAYVVQNNTDIIMLTVFADLKLIAVYSVYHLVCFSIRNITASFTGGMEAAFGEMIAKGEDEALCSTYEKYKCMLTFLTVTLFGATAILIVPFVKIYTSGVTDTEYSQPVFAMLMILGEAINCLILPCFNMTIAANKLKESQMGAYGEAAVNLIISFILVLWNPLVGVAIGTLVSSLFKSIFYIVYSGKNILKINVKRMLLNLFLCLLVLTVIGVFGILIIMTIPITNYLSWILCGFVAVALTGVVAALLSAIMYQKNIFTIIVKK
ncbi:MAG: hypothetical protein IJE74_07260 [Clostridia bacterium]|nr:hypothetical protein [Clostridia bacterium]